MSKNLNLKLQEFLNEISDPTSKSTVAYLSSWGINGNNLKLLVNALIKNQNAQQPVTTVNLCNNDIDEIDAQELGRLLSENNKITTLYLANNRLGLKGMEALRDPIIKHQVLTILDIGNNQLGQKGKEETEVLSKIITENKKLASLYLNNNDFSLDEVEILAKAIYRHEGLTTLDLSGNVVNQKGWNHDCEQQLKSICSSLSTLTKLTLNNTRVNLEELLKSSSLIEELIISDYPPRGIMSFYKAKLDAEYLQKIMQKIMVTNTSLITTTLPAFTDPKLQAYLERNKALANSKKQAQDLL